MDGERTSGERHAAAERARARTTRARAREGSEPPPDRKKIGQEGESTGGGEPWARQKFDASEPARRAPEQSDGRSDAASDAAGECAPPPHPTARHPPRRPEIVPCTSGGYDNGPRVHGTTGRIRGGIKGGAK
jgi:hypothetical protein